jgi:cytosine deaminase
MDKFMKAAFDEAKKSLTEGGIPIGAVLVKNGNIIGRGHNLRVQCGDPTAHAEIACLRNAGRIGSYNGTVLYSTLSPCYMCSGAVLLFKIPKVVIGENRNFNGGERIMRAYGIKIVNLQDPKMIKFFASWTKKNLHLWDEDIGELKSGPKKPKLVNYKGGC